MLVCRDVIVDAMTGNVSLIHIFAKFGVPQFPGHLAPCKIFASVTNGQGDYSVTAEVQDLDTGNVLAKAQGPTFKLRTRFHTHNVIMQVPPLPVPHEGKYDFVLFANGDEIDRQTMTVEPKQQRGAR